MREQKSVFIAGSENFYDKIKEAKKILEENNIQAYIHDNTLNNTTSEEDRESILNTYRLIKNCDVVYVYSQNGEIGHLGMDETTYAYACNKDTILSENTTNDLINKLSRRRMDLEQLINYVLNK